jgi:hypothetical protein
MNELENKMQEAAAKTQAIKKRMYAASGVSLEVSVFRAMPRLNRNPFLKAYKSAKQEFIVARDAVLNANMAEWRQQLAAVSLPLTDEEKIAYFGDPNQEIIEDEDIEVIVEED